MTNICQRVASSMMLDREGVIAMDLCESGMKEAARETEALIATKHEWGLLRGKLGATKQTAALESELDKKISDMKTKWQANIAACDRNDAKSCGYIGRINKYYKSFGFERPVVKPTPMPFQTAGDSFILIEDRLNTSQEIMIDTGMPVTGVPASFLASQQASFQRLNTFSTTANYAPKNTVMHIGSESFSPPIVVATGFLDYYEGTDKNHRMVAILGMDYLKQRAFEINFDTSRFVTNQDVTARLKDGSWRPVTLHVAPAMDAFWVKVLFNDKPVFLMFDTGAAETTIGASCAKKLGLEEKGGEGWSQGFEGEHSSVEMHPARITFGDDTIDLNTIDAEESPLFQGLAFEGVCGVIGVDILKRHNTLYDPASLTLYIQKRSTPPAPEFKGPGIKFNPQPERGGWILSHIYKGTPASSTGLQTGDIVVAINGKQTLQMTILEYYTLLSKGNSSIILTVVRNGKSEDIKITLKHD